MANLPPLLFVLSVACSVVCGMVEQSIDGETAANTKSVNNEVAKPLQEYLRRGKRALDGASGGVSGRTMSKRFSGISHNIEGARKQFTAAEQEAEGTGGNADHTDRRIAGKIANVRIRRQNVNVKPGDWKDVFDKLMIAMNGAYGSEESTNSSEAGKTKRSTELGSENLRVRRQNVNVKPGDWKDVFDKLMIAMNGAYGSEESTNSSEAGKTKRSTELGSENLRVRRQNVNVKPGDWKDVFDKLMIAMNGAYGSGENANSSEAGKTKRSTGFENANMRVRRQNIDAKTDEWRDVIDKFTIAMKGALGNGDDRKSKRSNDRGTVKVRNRRQEMHLKPHDWMDVWDALMIAMQGAVETKNIGVEAGEGEGATKNSPEDSKVMWDTFVAAMKSAVRSWEKEVDAKAK